MSTLHTALRCLKHPATLLSIGLLLSNDHWLKASFPSWWTGKLSDFAGLFFFPFLLAPLVGLLLESRRDSPRTTGRVAIALTALWFASFKTLPPVNAATNALLALLLGHPVQLLLDPTDLLALSALVPSWLLWAHEAQASNAQPSRRAWVALAFAILATAATSPLPPIISIQRLDVQGGKLYAYSVSIYRPTLSPYPDAYSGDGGRTWSYVPSPQAVPPSLRQPVQEGCDPGDQQICYRLQPEQVEASRDGGKTYQVVWSIPWGRRFFMQRENLSTGLQPEKQLDIGPYDLLFIPPLGTNGLSTVVFAMGNEGVLVRTPEGAWERYEVETAEPTPFTAVNLFDAFRTIPVEADAATFLILLTFSFLSIRAASAFKQLGQSRHSVAWAIWPLVIIDVLFLIGWVAWAWAGFFGFGSYFPFGLLLFFALAFKSLWVPMLSLLLILVGVLIYWSWKRIAQLAPDKGIAARPFWRTLFVTIGVWLATWGSLLLWAFGIIPLYELALGLAILLTLALLVWGVRNIPPAAQTAGG